MKMNKYEKAQSSGMYFLPMLNVLVFKYENIVFKCENMKRSPGRLQYTMFTL